jgi:hypothetical protein
LAKISAAVRSGLVAANKIAIGPTSSIARIAARSTPAASKTAVSSSMYSCQGGRASDGAGSEPPVPRRSKWMTLANEASRR